MNQDNLRSEWNKSNESFSEYDRLALPPIYTRTALDNLASRYKRFAIIGGICSVCIPIGMGHQMPPGTLTTVTVTLFALYFLTAAIIDLWLYNHIRDINVATSSMKEIVVQAGLCRKVHLRSMIVLIPFAIVVIGLMFRIFSSSIYFVYGMISGAAVGLIAGTAAFMRFMADYRAIRRNYEL